MSSKIKECLRPLTFVVMICALALQFVAPANASPFQTSSSEQHLTMDQDGVARTQALYSGDSKPQMADCNEIAADCMPSACNFYESTLLSKLALSGAFLPADMTVDQVLILPSHLRVSKDRPPQHM